MKLLSLLLLLILGSAQVIEIEVYETGYNKSVPGPRIDVVEGQLVQVRVTNYLREVTSVHFHGQYQVATPQFDGVPGLSQCGIKPGESYMYSFKAEPSGTFWYHSHSSAQYMDGFYGAFIVHPLSDPYLGQVDLDQEILVVDWYNQPSSALMAVYEQSIRNGGGRTPQPNAIMVNGRLGNLVLNATGHRFAMYRFINSGARSMWNITCLRAFQIIEIDGSLIQEGFLAKSIVINVAQRISVLVDVMPDLTILVLAVPSTYHDDNGIRFYTRFDINVKGGIGSETLVFPPNYKQPDLRDAEPLFPKVIPPANITLKWNAEFDLNSKGWYVAFINGFNFANMENANVPMLYSANFSGGLVQYIPSGSVVDVILNVQETSEHPIHLHGHRFWIMETSDWNRTGGVQRDTVSVPVLGWARIRFIADRHTAYMLHCHILAHSVNGFSSLIVETPYKPLAGPMTCSYNAMTSSAWKLTPAILLNVLILLI